MIVVINTRAEHIEQLVAHQQCCFPGLEPEDWISAQHFATHLQLFPDGQHVALAGEQVVGQSSTFRVRGELALAPHSYHGICVGNTFSNHAALGEWLYGADISVHPDYRGRGIATKLYSARKELIRRLGLRGMLAGGMLPGYQAYRARMSAEAYVALVARGELRDPTLTPQLRNGFVVHSILRGYLHDNLFGDEAALIVWENPEYVG